MKKKLRGQKLWEFPRRYKRFIQKWREQKINVTDQCASGRNRKKTNEKETSLKTANKIQT